MEPFLAPGGWDEVMCTQPRFQDLFPGLVAGKNPGNEVDVYAHQEPSLV